MFRFSSWLRKREDLEGWEKWFAKKNIKTEIREDPVTNLFALFREGEEAIAREVKE